MANDNNTLDLRGLIDNDLTLIDVQGKSWPIAVDLPLRTALVLLQHASAWEAGEMTAASFDATVDGMWAILKRRTPGVSRDEVLDGFSVSDMLRAIQWLSLAMRTPAEEPTGTVPASAQEKAQVTPKPKRSHKKLKVAT